MSIVVLCTDERDRERAEKTIRLVRTRGKWDGKLAWVAIDFTPDKDFTTKWGVWVLPRKAINMSWLWDIRQKHGFKDTDGREQWKLVQFSKWRIFDVEFKKYKSMLYLDAGMYVGNPITPIFSLPHQGKFLAPDDRYPFDDPTKVFMKQWDHEALPEKSKELHAYCEENNLTREDYFLNCLWLMDTSLIKPDTQARLLALARKFPISRTNEMAVMNLHFLNDWVAFPEKLGDFYLFDWTERFGRQTDEHILIKYSFNFSKS